MYLDERHWPLSLTRAWGHLGLCLSWLERSNASDEVAVQLKAADDRLHELYDDEHAAATHPRFPTRARAVLNEARARMILEADVDQAIGLFERAISEYPFSRTYLGLASALEQLGEQEAVHANQHRTRARMLMAHAETLGRGASPPTRPSGCWTAWRGSSSCPSRPGRPARRRPSGRAVAVQLIALRGVDAGVEGDDDPLLLAVVREGLMRQPRRKQHELAGTGSMSW